VTWTGRGSGAGRFGPRRPAPTLMIAPPQPVLRAGPRAFCAPSSRPCAAYVRRDRRRSAPAPGWPGASTRRSRSSAGRSGPVRPVPARTATGTRRRPRPHPRRPSGVPVPSRGRSSAPGSRRAEACPGASLIRPPSHSFFARCRNETSTASSQSSPSGGSAGCSSAVNRTYPVCRPVTRRRKPRTPAPQKPVDLTSPERIRLAAGIVTRPGLGGRIRHVNRAVQQNPRRHSIPRWSDAKPEYPRSRGALPIQIPHQGLRATPHQHDT